MSAGVYVDRLRIAVHGVSSFVVEEAASGLETELRRRLGGRRGSWRVTALPTLRVGPLDLPPGADAAQLRGLIADRLLDVLFGGASEAEPEETD